MEERTCAHCGAELDEVLAIEQDGVTFCSEECADKFEEDALDE